MAIKAEMPDTIGGGGEWLRTPIKGHFVVIETDESPSWPSGDPIDGFKVTAEVLSEEYRGEKFDFIFKNPLPTWSEKGIEFCKKKQAACLIALGFVKPENMGKPVEVELEGGLGRQFFAEVDYEKDENGNDKVSDKGHKFLQLAWSNFFHVDDPMAKNYPRDEQSLAVIPAAHRITAPAFFDAIRGKKPGKAGSASGNASSSNNGSAKAATKSAAKPASPAMAAVSTDLGDL